MGDYNIHQWIEKIFTDKDCEDILTIYNAHTGENLSLALLPFLSHETLESVLHDVKMNVRAQLGDDHSALMLVESLLRKLDVDSYWLDMTTLGMPYRREYNTVTEMHREVDRFENDDEIFGNVRKTL
jgi:hypothetical protein